MKHYKIDMMNYRNVSLTPQLENIAKRSFEAGLYDSVDEALRLLIEGDEVNEMKLVSLRGDLQKGIDSLDRGEGSPLEMNDIKAKARAIKANQA